MSHQPPIPDAATSPYPLHPAPIASGHSNPASTSEAGKDRATGPENGLSAGALGVGAAVAFGTVAAVGGLLWTLRRTRRSAAARGSNAKGKRGGSAQRRTARKESYEVSYFARKHRISAADARDIIKKAGPDREAANRLAAQRAK